MTDWSYYFGPVAKQHIMAGMNGRVKMSEKEKRRRDQDLTIPFKDMSLND
jgi:hypothetical protein